MKRLPFLPKMVYKRVIYGWDLRAESASSRLCTCCLPYSLKREKLEDFLTGKINFGWKV